MSTPLMVGKCRGPGVTMIEENTVMKQRKWRGGGVALGPKPRDYSQRTPKKMVRLAVRSALSDRAASKRVVVIDAWDFEVPKTREAADALDALGADGRVLVVAERADLNTWKSFANLGRVHVVSPGELNAYDVLVSDWVIFTERTLPNSLPSPAGVDDCSSGEEES